jgi:hypothetical protein
MKNFIIKILYWIFSPIRFIITYKRKSCFWGHSWGKWTLKDREMIRRYRTGEKIQYTETYQYRYCKRCNKYEEEII